MKIGFALAGGGVKGAAHLGVIKALEEEGIIGEVYTGTSAGSIVASLKALGFDNKQTFDMLTMIDKKVIDVNWWGALKFILTRSQSFESIAKGKKIKKILKEVFCTYNIKDVKYPLAVVATNIDNSSQVIFSSKTFTATQLSLIDNPVYQVNRKDIPLKDITYASSSVPGVFKPSVIEGQKLVDGCLTNNLPMNLAHHMGADIVVGIDLAERKRFRKTEGLVNILTQSLNILIDQNVDLAQIQADRDILIYPDLSHINMLNFDAIDEVYNIGYSYGKTIAPKVKKEIEEIEKSIEKKE